MIKRTIEKVILKSIENFPVTLITGARQVGKSTLCYEISKKLGYTYVSLDDITLRKDATNDPKFFLSKYKTPLIIDEIQYAPILFEVIESIVNKARLTMDKPNGLFILTGSQSYHLMRGVTQSLAGRINIIPMLPLSYNEVNSFEDNPLSFDIESYFNAKRKDDINNIFSRIVKGFYPEVHKNSSLNVADFYKAYISTYIDRDVTEIINVTNKLKFHNFMQFIASLTGQQVNYDSIAKSIGIDVKTVKDWICVLESSNIIYFLQPYFDSSITKRIVKTPKLFFYDTGLACYLAKFNDSQTLQNSYFSGAYFETYVVNELLKSFSNNGKVISCYFYRDSNQNEIDLVLVENANLHLIEIKSGMKFDSSTVKSFDQLSKSKFKMGVSYVICMTDTVYKIKDSIYAIPIYYLGY